MRAWMVLKLYSAPKLHEQRVNAIRAQILAWKASGASTKRNQTWFAATPFPAVHVT